MLKCEIYHAWDLEQLENVLHEASEELEKDHYYKVIDYKFSTVYDHNHKNILYTAMLIYDDTEKFDELDNVSSNVLTWPLGTLGLSFRAAKSLGDAGITRVSEVIKKTRAELLAIPKFGLWCLDDLRECLDKHDLKWKQSKP